MGFSGLDAISKIAQQQEARPGGDVAWFKLKGGASSKIRFLQELDGDSKYYNEDKGLIKVFVEHSDPADFRKKMQCSMESEGRCYGCEQHKANPKAGWKGRPRLYTAVLVKNGDESEVQILSQGVGAKSITPTLIEYTRESGSLTDRGWKITRTGEGKDTSYNIIAFDRVEGGFDDFDEYEVPDLERICTRTIPYDEQADFFNGGVQNVDDAVSDGPSWSNKGNSAESPLAGW